MQAHRLLVISRICEEFGLSPLQAQRELDLDPEHLALDIIEVRSYMRCKHAYDGATDGADDKLDPWRDTPTLEMVMENTHALYKERGVLRTHFKKPAIVLTDPT